MDKHIVVYPYKQIFISNNKNWTMNICSMGEFQITMVNERQSQTKHILYDSLYKEILENSS